MPWWSLHPVLLSLLLLQWLLLPAGPQSRPAVTGDASLPPMEIRRPPAGPGPDLVAVIAGRPLFSETRRPPEAAPETVTPPDAPRPPAQPLRATLQAVLGGPDARMALLADSGGTIHRLRQGDELQGWRLETIDPLQVRFTRDGNSLILPLRDY